MQTGNVNQKSKNDPVWYYLAEYSLSDLMVDGDIEDELTAGLLFPTFRNLGLPPECLKKIDGALAGFAKEAMAHFNQGRLKFPVSIRLFCEKKTIEIINSAKSTRHINAEQSIEPTPIIYHHDNEMSGGWGYFLIERGEDLPAGSSGSSRKMVDLYLYKEGE